MGKQENTQNREGVYFEKMCSTPSFYSPNIGIMKKVLDKKSSNYSNLKVFLQKIYEALYPNLDMYNIYEFLQQLNHNDKIVQSSSLLEDSLESLVEKYPRWQPARARNNGSWIQIGYSLKEDNGKVYPAQPEDIKVYATFKDSNIQDVYVKSIEYLLQNARNVFVAKLLNDDKKIWWALYQSRSWEEVNRYLKEEV